MNPYNWATWDDQTPQEEAKPTYRPELPIVKIYSQNLNTFETTEIYEVKSVEYAKFWLTQYADQNDMTRSVGKYWNENECVWLWVSAE